MLDLPGGTSTRSSTAGGAGEQGCDEAYHDCPGCVGQPVRHDEPRAHLSKTCVSGGIEHASSTEEAAWTRNSHNPGAQARWRAMAVIAAAHFPAGTNTHAGPRTTSPLAGLFPVPVLKAAVASSVRRRNSWLRRSVLSALPSSWSWRHFDDESGPVRDDRRYSVVGISAGELLVKTANFRKWAR